MGIEHLVTLTRRGVAVLAPSLDFLGAKLELQVINWIQSHP